MPSDECSKDFLELFFTNGFYNSCKETDELLKRIERLQDENLAKRALILYQKYYSTLDKPWENVTFMYGLGLIYMHFNAYDWSIKAFREALYIEPNFAKSKDVHTRLGLIFKSTKLYKLSEKHFNLAINDSRPDSGTSTNVELKFHIAHLYEIQGKHKQAKEAYESLLQKEKDLPHQLSANIYRQLGWLYFYTNDTSITDPATAANSKSRKQNVFNHHQQHNSYNLDAALNHLSTSYRTDSDPKTSYYLGRCFTNIGKYQDAFAYYRSVIDREESTADTWCSIGVLYHRQNQPTDALQAYIRAVQFDKQHSVAWLNLGILYETHKQFPDALKCYQHVNWSNSNDNVDYALQARIRLIQKQISEIETSNNGNRSKLSSDKLLSLEDLWNLESKTTQNNSQHHAMPNCNNSNEINQQTVSGLTNSTNNPTASRTNNISLDSIENSKTSAEDQTARPINNINPLSYSVANSSSDSKISIENNNNNNNNDINLKKTNDTTLMNNSCANSLKEEAKCLDSKLNQFKFETQVNEGNVESNFGSKHPDPIVKTDINSLENDYKSDNTTQMIQNGCQDVKPNSSNLKGLTMNQVVLLTNGGASKDSGISSSSSNCTADSALVSSQNTNVIDSTKTKHKTVPADYVIDACRNSPKPKKIDINLLTDESKPPHMFVKVPPYPPIPPDQLLPSPPSVFLESKKDLASKKLQDFCQSSPISIVRNIASALKLDLGFFSTKTLVECNSDQEVQVISHIFQQLNPNDNSINEQQQQQQNTRKNDRHQQWTCKRQLFYSTIARYANYQVATFRESLQEEVDNKSSSSKQNMNNNLTKESETDSNESASANQQHASKQKQLNNTGQFINTPNQSQTTTNTNTTSNLNNDNMSNNNLNQNINLNPPKIENGSGQPACKKLKKDLQQQVKEERIKYVKSAHMIDLSNEKKWRPQLNELNKLPSFIKCVSASNMLTHIGNSISGINAIVMDMHVPGCRFLGNRTMNNNFCSVNINIGPGDYEWCAIPAEYVATMKKLCRKYDFEFDDNNWWPIISDLQKHNIPIYRFSQRPGDLVWINSGTFYWVQATGWCNNIYWSVGPLSEKQFKFASQMIELDKFLFKKSNVPMIQMTWNLVMNIHILTEDNLYQMIVDLLRRSLQYCTIIKDLIDESKQEIKNSTSNKDEEEEEEENGDIDNSVDSNGSSNRKKLSPMLGPKSGKFCSLCEWEIFNIYFVDKQPQGVGCGSGGGGNGSIIIHCIECARRLDQTFARYDIKQDYDLKYLMKLYDNFIESRRKYQASREQTLDID